jgi:hypothetical protein
MRKRTGIFSVLLAAAALWAASAAAAPVQVSVSFFHDQLAPHGRWVSVASYGSCWVPSGVAAGWEPYVDGEWAYSDYGWTWVGDDPWGDIPYHYGTWARADPYGWVWIPGTVWAPAWVTWAYTDDYIGWAPVPPSFVLSATGYFGPPVVVTATRYVCVPTRQFVGVRVASVRVPAPQTVAIVQRAVKTTRFEVGQGVVRVAGPPPRTVERAIGRPVPRVPVDRLRAQPTSLAAGGVAQGRSVRVVAPEKERARIATEKAEARPARTAPQKQQESRPAPAPASAAARQEKAPKHAPAAKPAPAPEKDADADNHKQTAKAAREHESAQAEARRPESNASLSKDHGARPPQQKPKPKAQPPKEKEKEKPSKDSDSSHS